jgi:hypothetical protein
MLFMVCGFMQIIPKTADFIFITNGYKLLKSI